jgi:hypothetical protein
MQALPWPWEKVKGVKIAPWRVAQELQVARDPFMPNEAAHMMEVAE